MENIDRENKYLRAKERLALIKKFYSNIISYVLFISFFAVLNYYNNGWRNMWFLWVAFGWGLGLLIKAVKLFGTNVFLGRDWEERKIREFMQKDKEQGKWN